MLENFIFLFVHFLLLGIQCLKSILISNIMILFVTVSQHCFRGSSLWNLKEFWGWIKCKANKYIHLANLKKVLFLFSILNVNCAYSISLPTLPYSNLLLSVSLNLTPHLQRQSHMGTKACKSNSAKLHNKLIQTCVKAAKGRVLCTSLVKQSSQSYKLCQQTPFSDVPYPTF